MKKSLLICAAVAAVLSTSCSDGKNTSESTYNIPIFNYVTKVDGTGEPVITASYYTYQMDMMNSTMTVAAKIGTSTNGFTSFTTSSIPFTPLYYSFGNTVYEIIKAESYTAGKTDNGDPINNLYCELTSLMNTPPVIDGLPDVSQPSFKYTYMQYNIGSKYTVRTFWPDVTFTGTTDTRYPGGTYTTKNIMYRVVMNISDSKATVILYNAQLADKMPVLTNIVLKDLPLEFKNYGYVIKAENVVPSQYEGGEATPNNNFIFTKFELSSYGNLTDVNVDYEVNGSFNGTFNGSCITTLKDLADENL